MRTWKPEVDLGSTGQIAMASSTLPLEYCKIDIRN